MNKKSQTEIVLNTLTSSEKKILKKNHPFKKEREKIIKSLRDKGVEISIINKISGVPKSTISRIARNYPPATKYAILNELKEIRESLNLIKDSILARPQ